jgi:hypothetical protein
MKWKFDYLFFNVYNWYNKMRLSGRKVDPTYLTVAIFAFSHTMWCFAIYLFCDRLFIHHYLNKIMWPCLTIVWILFYYFLNTALIDNYRYLDIYNKYKDYAASNTKAKRDTLISILFVILPVLIVLTVGAISIFKQIDA